MTTTQNYTAIRSTRLCARVFLGCPWRVVEKAIGTKHSNCECERAQCSTFTRSPVNTDTSRHITHAWSHCLWLRLDVGRRRRRGIGEQTKHYSGVRFGDGKMPTLSLRAQRASIILALRKPITFRSISHTTNGLTRDT